MYLDRFKASDAAGLLLLHGYGNVLERTLGQGETIQVEPGGFLYKDAAVGVETVTHKLDRRQLRGVRARCREPGAWPVGAWPA